MNKYSIRKYQAFFVFIFLVSYNAYCQKSDISSETKKSIKANFHHIHLNVVNRDSTIFYYEKFFGATRIKYRGKTDALFTEKSFLLLDLVDVEPPSHLGSSLWHIGWSGVESTFEMNWRVKEGIKVHTPSTPLGENHWMYFWGPNKELVEIYTGNKNHRFEHIHLLSTDVDKTMSWFESFLGLVPKNKKAIEWKWGNSYQWNMILVNNINIIAYSKPAKEEPWWPKEGFIPTDDTAVDHIGFSFENIDPIFENMKSSGVIIVQGIQIDPVHGHKSFFVRGPDRLLVEIVEEKSIPEGIWR